MKIASETLMKLVEGHIVKRTVPLFRDAVCEIGDTLEILGTGTLFAHDGRHFIVTAAHCFKEDINDLASADIDLTGVAIPVHPRNAEPVTLGTFDLYTYPPSDNIDIAVIELKSPTLVTQIQVMWEFAELAEAIKANSNFADGWVMCGYPRSTAKFKNGGIYQSPITIWTGKLPVQSDAVNPDVGRDLFFDLDGRITTLAGEEIEMPELFGISGCTIWHYSEGVAGFWDPSKTIRVEAVETSVKERRWIRGVSWRLVLDVLHHAPSLQFSM